ATGTNLLSSGDNVVSAATAIGFTFNFFGANFTTLFVSSNGLITFGSSTTSAANATLSANPTQAAIAPFWDDLNITNSTATARVAGATNLTRAIANFTSATAGTYYARITGDSSVPYSLVVTRSAAFDAEPNNSFATAQGLNGTAGALGSIFSGTTTVVPGGLA